MKLFDVNKPTNRFLLLSVLFFVATAVLFFAICYQAHRHHEAIVNLYCAESVPNPANNGQLDRTVVSLLQLELDKIDQGLTILSIWAGVMMIVFLVFSLYSMHRSDELEKESQQSLENVRTASARIKEEADKSIKEVDEKSKKEIETVHKLVETQKLEYENMTKEKQDAFEDVYKKYKADLDRATKNFNDGLKTVVNLLKNLPVDDDEEGHEDSES